MPKISEQEYHRLKDIERKYLQLLAEQKVAEEEIHSPAEKTSVPDESGETAGEQTTDVDAAWEDFRENYMSHADAFETEPVAGEQADPKQSTESVILMEQKFGAMDVWTLLSRLSAFCKISGDPDKVPLDNAAYILCGEKKTVQFTANDFRANTAIKLEAKEAIWNATRQCDLLGSVHEAELSCTVDPSVMVCKIADEMRNKNCTPLFAVAHGLSNQPHLFFLWMDDNTDSRWTMADFLKTTETPS